MVAACALRERGVGAGDRVAIRLSNSPAFVAAYFGALRLGAIVVPLNVLLAPPEVEERIAASTPVTLVDDELPVEGDPVGEIVPRGARDPAVVLFTSGTSGRSKGAILTHGGVRAAARNAADALALGSGRRDARRGAVLARPGPVDRHRLDAARRWRGLGRPAVRGGADARDHDADAEPRSCSACRRCASRCARPHAGSPALPPVRIAHVGGAAVPEGVARDFERTFGGDVVEGYGLTELSGIATTFPVGAAAEARLRRRPPRRHRASRSVTPTARASARSMFRGPSVIPGVLERPGGDGRRRSTRTAGSPPATWAVSTRTATSTSSTARRS